MLLTNDAGAITDSYGITPYGETVTPNGTTSNPFTWLGRFGVMQEASTGLYYMRARYYNSATARFLSPDPVISADPMQVNPYAYSRANPIGVSDPEGTEPEIPFPATVERPIIRAQGWSEIVFPGAEANPAGTINYPKGLLYQSVPGIFIIRKMGSCIQVSLLWTPGLGKGSGLKVPHRWQIRIPVGPFSTVVKPTLLIRAPAGQMSVP